MATEIYAYRAARNAQQAVVEVEELVFRGHPDVVDGYRYLAACYAHMGRLDDAREVVTRLRAITPLVVPSVGYLRNEHREFLLSGLRLAAGEAT